MFDSVLKIIKLINSEQDPMQLSLGFAFAMIVGMTPLLSLHNLLVLLLILVLRVNLSAFLLGWALFSGIAWMLDPWFHDFGTTILQHASLQSLWTDMYNNSLWRLTRFNNTVVMGSLAVSLAAFIPLVLLGNLLVRRYRVHVVGWVRSSRIGQAVMANNLFRRYQALRGMIGE